MHRFWRLRYGHLCAEGHYPAFHKKIRDKIAGERHPRDSFPTILELEEAIGGAKELKSYCTINLEISGSLVHSTFILL